MAVSETERDHRSVVSVITRTKNRPLLLVRALDSISGQDYWHIEWIIVNDGGDRDCVDEVAREAGLRGLGARVIHNETSIGMEAASNSGLAIATGKYVTIHDDDDTWAPDFLRACVHFLESEPRFQGVVTHTIQINEVVSESGPLEVARFEYNPGLASVQLADMCIRNHFPPISFVFTRDALAELGGFDEELPVLGDWDFNLRFLCRFDIGVVPRPLANYHIRATSDGAYSNSLSAAQAKHAQYDSVVRHKHYRADVEKGSAGAGHLLLQARLNTWQNADLGNSMAERFATDQSHFRDQLGFVSNQLLEVQTRFEDTLHQLRVAVKKIPLFGKGLPFERKD